MKLYINIILLIFTVNILSAGVEIEYKVTDNQNNEKHNQTIYLSDNDFTVHNASDEGNIIYKGDIEVLYVIDHDKKEYFEMTRSDVFKISEKLKQAEKMMQEQLSQMPEEQRKQMKKMLDEKMGKINRIDMIFKYEKVGESKNIAGHNAEKYNVYINDEKDDQVLWVTPFSKFDLNQSDFKAFDSFKKYVEELFSSIGTSTNIKFDMFWDFSSLKGLPVQIENYNEDGTLRETSVLESIKKKNIDDTLFRVPDGYKRKNLNLN